MRGHVATSARHDIKLTIFRPVVAAKQVLEFPQIRLRRDVFFVQRPAVELQVAEAEVRRLDRVLDLLLRSLCFFPFLAVFRAQIKATLTFIEAGSHLAVRPLQRH